MHAGPAAAPNGAAVEEPEQKEEKAPDVPAPKKPPVKLNKDFASWEKHTKGIGSKLLAKMGFAGRLGKDQSGVTRHVEVKVRPAGIGLGFGNFKEASALKANREIEADRQGKTLEELDKQMGIDSGKKKAKSKAEAGAEAGMWRKGASSKRRKRQYVTSAELIEQLHEEGLATEGKERQVIVDMRGPQVKHLSTLEDIEFDAADQGLVAGEPPKLGQELLHNVTMLVEQAEHEARAAHGALAAEDNRVKVLKRDRDEIKRRYAGDGERVSRLETVGGLLQKVSEKVESSPESVTVAALLNLFKTLRDQFPEEFTVFGLSHLAPGLATPLIKRELDGWEPLAEPGKLADVLGRWQQVLEAEAASEGAFGAIVDKVVLPSVRSALVNDWEVTEPEAAVELTKTLNLLMGSESLKDVLAQAVVPKLTAAVAKWTAKEPPLHKWVLPWLPHLKKELKDLYPQIRRRLAQSLGSWLPGDGVDAAGWIKPWSGVFDERSMLALLSKAIIPKLALTLSQTLVINPAKQDLDPFLAVMEWQRLLPQMHIASLMEGEFFPKWLKVLHHWLTSEGSDFAEVAGWYQSWKSLFPADLQEDSAVAAKFAQALKMMEAAMGEAPVPAPSPSPKETSYSKVLKRRQIEAANAASKAITAKPKLKAVGGVVSFKEVVEEFGENHGYPLIPRPGSSKDGKQIYTFGACQLYLDQEVVYVKVGSSWSPLGLEDLLAYANNVQDAK
ncbi:unnamed protein product [Chrysoparadoxa australica]